MTGYDGTHQDWLEGQAADQLERERRECDAGIIVGEAWTPVHGWLIQPQRLGLDFELSAYGQPRAWFTMPLEQAVRFANSILAEVQLAQRGGE